MEVILAAAALRIQNRSADWQGACSIQAGACVMTAKKKKWLIGIAVVATLALATLFIAGWMLAGRFEPYIHEQAILYLEKRFDSDVELGSFHISMPKLSPLRMIRDRGRGSLAQVDGEGITLRRKGANDSAPIFLMKKYSFVVDLGTLFEERKTVRSVKIDGMEINIPPKGQRPRMGSDSDADHTNTGVLIEEVLITNSILRILPKKAEDRPLEFDLHRIRLNSAGKDVAMQYEATLSNAKPPGEIHSHGTFGPWAATEPGDSPVAGEYDFKNADLGVFDGIAGTLDSLGEFEGTLDSLNVKGTASVPNFRLKSAGNPVPLYTEFTVLVDGTNGNTILKPVFGRLGKTEFKTSGGVIKREKHGKRDISLDVVMPNGNLRDLLTLAMKGTPFMEGRIKMNAKIDIPPLDGKVRRKLLLDGNFEITQARFLKSTVQEKIDELSRRGQGKPKDGEIVEVPSGLAGSFKLANELFTFRSLAFAVPGAGVDIAGDYNLRTDVIDFHGTLKLQAKVSQTMTGWKRWALKPIDPFFSKQGAGTLLKIQVVGTSKEPQFGREKGKKDSEEASTLRAKPDSR
jgi:hypothetical protein